MCYKEEEKKKKKENKKTIIKERTKKKGILMIFVDRVEKMSRKFNEQ